MDPIPDYGWGAAVTVLVILIGAIVRRGWLHDKERRDELAQAEADYRAAVQSGDFRRIALAARRVRHARDRAGSGR